MFFCRSHDTESDRSMIYSIQEKKNIKAVCIEGQHTTSGVFTTFSPISIMCNDSFVAVILIICNYLHNNKIIRNSKYIHHFLHWKVVKDDFINIPVVWYSACEHVREAVGCCKNHRQTDQQVIGFLVSSEFSEFLQHQIEIHVRGLRSSSSF